MEGVLRGVLHQKGVEVRWRFGWSQWGSKRWWVGVTPLYAGTVPNLAGAVGCPFLDETQARSQFYGDDSFVHWLTLSTFDLHIALLPISASCSNAVHRSIFSPNELLQTWPSLDLV